MENLQGLGTALPDAKKAGRGRKAKPAKADDVEDILDEDEEADPSFFLDKEAAVQALKGLGREGLVDALQDKLDQLVGRSSGFVDSLPFAVRNRVEGLRGLQEEHDDLHEKFIEERDALEAKYRTLYKPIYDKRADIIAGTVEVPVDEDDAEEAAASASEECPPGIPHFWLNALKNHEALEEQITEKDEGPLEFLKDITEEPLEDQKGFRLSFFFGPNPFFTNSVLTKSYFMVDDDEPILEKAEGTDIQWESGKNVTVKVLKKKPKKGARNQKVLTKMEPCESFFNFFSPPQVPEEEDELEEEEAEQLQDAMEMDYEIGSVIKEKIIPGAVMWFTGEAFMDDEDDEDDDDDDEDEDDEDEDEDEDDSEEDEAPAKGKKGGTRGKGFGGGAAAPADAAEKPAECKQQ